MLSKNPGQKALEKLSPVTETICEKRTNSFSPPPGRNEFSFYFYLFKLSIWNLYRVDLKKKSILNGNKISNDNNFT